MGVFAEYGFVDASDMSPGTVGVAGEQHDKLIASPAADQVAGAGVQLQAGGELAEQLVACEVTVPVVDLLEAVQVEHQDAEGLAVGDIPLDALFGAAAVGGAGELIL